MGCVMKNIVKRRRIKGLRFVVDENIRKFFPPTLPMAFETPPDYHSGKPVKCKHDRQDKVHDQSPKLPSPEEVKGFTRLDF